MYKYYIYIFILFFLLLLFKTHRLYTKYYITQYVQLAYVMGVICWLLIITR